MLAHCGVDKAMKIVHGNLTSPIPSLHSLGGREYLEGVDVCHESPFDE
jgi:hypothetical protein